MFAVSLRFFKDRRNDEIALQHFFFLSYSSARFFFYYICAACNCFSSDKRLQEIFFQNHPPPPPPQELNGRPPEKTISRRFLINNFTLGTVLENLRFLEPENAV